MYTAGCVILTRSCTALQPHHACHRMFQVELIVQLYVSPSHCCPRCACWCLLVFVLWLPLFRSSSLHLFISSRVGGVGDVADACGDGVDFGAVFGCDFSLRAVCSPSRKRGRSASRSTATPPCAAPLCRATSTRYVECIQPGTYAWT